MDDGAKNNIEESIDLSLFGGAAPFAAHGDGRGEAVGPWAQRPARL